MGPGSLSPALWGTVGRFWDLSGGSGGVFPEDSQESFGIILPRGNESIYLHRSGPLLENGLDRPENRYGRYGFASFSSISISTVGLDGARVSI